jgi:methylenetetrahydrofolate dehydrogenase (NADP+)/methenyltetrahydrofolate cyclohydrolase
LGAKLIDGKAIAGAVREEVASGVAEMREKHGVIPGLAAVLVGDDPASAVYVRNKEKAAAEAGIKGEVFRLSGETSQEELLELVGRLNADDTFHGILVQLPLPSQIDEDRVIEAISPDKDVDGLHPVNMGRLMAGRPRFVPATPSGIHEMLLRSGNSPEGRHVVVCGRSNIVGKPVANLLMQRRPGANATVTVCHTRTRDLGSITRQADILIAAMGHPSSITADMVSEGVVVIDVGINRVDAPERKRGYRLVGDVDFDPVSEKAAAITPVPGGVGPMTIAMLLRNTLDAARSTIHPELAG